MMTLAEAVGSGDFEAYRDEFNRHRTRQGKPGTDYRLAEMLFHKMRYYRGLVIGLQSTYGTVVQETLPGTEAENGGE